MDDCVLEVADNSKLKGDFKWISSEHHIKLIFILFLIQNCFEQRDCWVLFDRSK